MTRKIKSLGLAFVAIAAMSMVVAAGVQASQVHVTKNVDTVVTGTVESPPHQLNQFTTQFGTTQCTQSQFEGTIAKAAEGSQITTKDITLTATYTGCTAFGQNATIDMNGCKFTITGEHSVQKATAAQTAYVDVTGCTQGKVIEITTPICTVTVPEQHNLSHIVLTNAGTSPNHDITADITVEKISYEGHGVLCPGGGATVLKTDGQYKGNATFRAYEGQGSVQATHNGHTYQKLTHNQVQIGMLAT